MTSPKSLFNIRQSLIDGAECLLQGEAATEDEFVTKMGLLIRDHTDFEPSDPRSLDILNKLEYSLSKYHEGQALQAWGNYVIGKYSRHIASIL